jgi:hypothetical protein
MDAYYERIVSYAMAEPMKPDLVTQALHIATKERRPPKGLVHHSDGVTVGALTEPWRGRLRRGEIPLTHELGRVCFERGDIEALLVPSAKNPEVRNLAVFPDRLAEGSSLRVFDDSGMIAAHPP